MAVEYEFYIERYGGSVVPESSWKKMEIKASARLQKYTFNRLEEQWSDDAKFALCEMVEYMSEYSERSGKVSENNDGYSVSYNISETLDGELYKIAENYLLHSGLMDFDLEEEDDY